MECGVNHLWRFVAYLSLFPFKGTHISDTELSGPWHIETCTVKTEFKKFEGMVLRYRAMFFREGSIIRGTAEKVYEDSNTLNDHNYVGPNRTRS